MRGKLARGCKLHCGGLGLWRDRLTHSRYLPTTSRHGSILRRPPRPDRRPTTALGFPGAMAVCGKPAGAARRRGRHARSFAPGSSITWRSRRRASRRRSRRSMPERRIRLPAAERHRHLAGVRPRSQRRQVELDFPPRSRLPNDRGTPPGRCARPPDSSPRHARRRHSITSLASLASRRIRAASTSRWHAHALVRLGERVFLEVIAIDPAGQARSAPLVRSRQRARCRPVDERAATHPLGRAHRRMSTRRRALPDRARSQCMPMERGEFRGGSRSPMTASLPARESSRR